MSEKEKLDLIDKVGVALHAQAQAQADEIYYGSSYVSNDVGSCRVDSDINFYDLARVAIELVEEEYL